MKFPSLPSCECEFQHDSSACPSDVIHDPFLYLPAPTTNTPAIQKLAERYAASDIDFCYYPAFQAASFIQPTPLEKHVERRTKFELLSNDLKSQGFRLPESLTRLFRSDDYIDRLHHNCIWPMLPDRIERFARDPRYALLLFMIKGQACGIWHLILSPDGGQMVVNADECIGCPSSNPDHKSPDSDSIKIYRCMDSISHFHYHDVVTCFILDSHYKKRLDEYFTCQPE